MSSRLALTLFCAAGVLLGPVAAQEPEDPGAKPRLLDARGLLSDWTNEYASIARSPALAPDPSEDEEEDPRIRGLIRDGYQQMASGNQEEALKLFEMARERDPANKRAVFALGTAFIQLDRFAAALEVLEPLMKKFPSDYRLKNNVAWLYATAKDESVRDAEQAVRLAQEALFQVPEDYHVWSTLAEAHYTAGRYDNAERAAQEALRLSIEFGANPRDVEGYREQVEKCKKAARALSVQD